MYFQVHQPSRLRKYSYFDIGNLHYYEDDQKNGDILRKVANKCYLPTNALLLALIKRYPKIFKISFSISGVIIDQFKRFAPEVLDSFKRLVDTGQVELLNETYYHSLSSLFSEDEFKEQVKMHADLIYDQFGMRSKTFRNTELIYNDYLATLVEEMGYKVMLAEGAEKILDWRSPNFVYNTKDAKNLKLLLRNYRLSDDIAFRFSNRAWCEYPLNTDKYANWVHALNGNADVVNLFMDYETFGEHQWGDTGIFAFLEHLPPALLKNKNFTFATPSEVSTKINSVADLSMPYSVSWADIERDLTAWCGNNLQEDALRSVYALEERVKATKDKELLHKWRSLLTSDHFYYMCVKFDNDGDVHKYFNPYNSPYDAYINFQNIVSDLNLEVEKKGG